MVNTCVFILVVFLCNAQGFQKAEYFFDTDGGPGSGIPITISGANDTINFSSTISTASLTPGFHFLGLRVQHNDGNWALFESRGFFVSSSSSDVTNISAAEYFFDTDPGAGAGTAINIGSAGGIVNFSIGIPAPLSAGFHFLGIRIRNTNGEWSLFESRGFYISSASADVSNITSAEYFIDNDGGGPGSGTPLVVGAAGSTVNFIANIPTSVSPGFHFLGIRVRNANGEWSLFESRGFYVSTGAVDATNIVAAEYFIDNDAGGPGSGNPVSIGSSGGTVNFTLAFPVSLSQGFHNLAIRVRNSAGVWSLFEQRVFYISPAATDAGIITAAEYFIDADPGVGLASPLVVNNPGNTINQTFMAVVPQGISGGQHMLAIRTRNADGIWSLFELDTFIVDGALPVNWLTFTAKKVGTTANLHWKTANESNNSHFMIERSRDGVQFISIGKVTGTGMQLNEYHFDDVMPFDGINFYRLKQVDNNGNFEYSSIVSLLFESKTGNLILFPNPATSILGIKFSGTEKKVAIHLFDATGKMVRSKVMDNTAQLQINVSELSPGIYTVITTDGITKQHGQFVKQ